MKEEPITTFVSLFERAHSEGAFVKLVLARCALAGSDLVRTTVRPVVLKGQPHLSFVTTHKTREITKNLTSGEAVQQIRDLVDSTYRHMHLFTTTDDIQLIVSKKGKQTLLRGKAERIANVANAHDRNKQRFLTLDRAFLTELGVTNLQHQLVPAMARKWKQINKFIEVLDHALQATALKAASSVDVVDFGSGKGYLTFAIHDYLRYTLGMATQVTGVELRSDMVELCSRAVQSLGIEGLHFEQGDVSSATPRPMDIMIALHACDTATDHAIHTGLRAGAAIIMCSPCCHKELRPQLLSPHPLRPILKHGVHLGLEAEMLTDGLRAMMLDACGYDTQVFEFVALEHTNKNKMILAVKRTTNKPVDEVWRQIDDIKSFYGIRDQCLEKLIRADQTLAVV